MAKLRPITLVLDENAVGQIIDGLCSRASEYRNAERYHNGEIVEDGIVEVSDADEAKSIAEYYESIIAEIQKQRNDQKEQTVDNMFAELQKNSLKGA